MARVRAVYDRLKINAELAPFFSDLPARLASSHLVISRSGAGTVAELGAIGRPSILVPLPGAIDQDQFANAGVLANGGRRDPHRAEPISRRTGWPPKFPRSPPSPARLAAMASGARTVGRLDAAERLADLVAKVAGLAGSARQQFRVFFVMAGLVPAIHVCLNLTCKKGRGCPGRTRRRLRAKPGHDGNREISP